jgi:hypothetical protein
MVVILETGPPSRTILVKTESYGPTKIQRCKDREAGSARKAEEYRQEKEREKRYLEMQRLRHQVREKPLEIVHKFEGERHVWNIKQEELRTWCDATPKDVVEWLEEQGVIHALKSRGNPPIS